MATYRQKLVAQKLVENGGNIGKAMVDAGYSTNTAKTPQKLTQSKGWKELSQELFSDEELARKTGELLDAFCVRKYIFPLSMPDEEIKELIESMPRHIVIRTERYDTFKKTYYMRPDNSIISQTLNMIYKLKGYYKQAKVEYHSPYEDMSDEELNEILRERDKHNPVCSYCLQPRPKQA